MRAGALRHWLTFEKLVVDQDSDGARVETWLPAFDVSSRMPCEVVALSGRELIAAQAQNSKVSHRIKVRYRPGLEPKMRARDPDGTIFSFEALIPDASSRIRHVTILATAGVNVG